MSILDVLFQALRDIETTRYAQLASSVIIIYDHTITFGDEIYLIWGASWSLGKGLFILNRYFALSSVLVNNYALFSPSLTDSFCSHFFHWQGWTGLIACMIAEVILQMRLYALYFLNKKVLAAMITSFIVSSSLSATVMGTVLSKVKARAHRVPGVTFCVPDQVGDHFYLFWIPILVFESLLVGLALFRGFQAVLSSDGSLFRSGRQLVNVLIRDSVLYFMVMFATYLTNLLVWIGASPNLLEVPIGFSVAMSCVLGNRIILNVRRTAEQAKRRGSPKGGDPEDGKSSRHIVGGNTSFFSPIESQGGGFSTPSAFMRSEGLSDFELDELREMRAEVPAWTNSYTRGWGIAM